jgi:parallel beta-helix repeat protein
MRQSLKRIGALAAGVALGMGGVVATAAGAGAMAPRPGAVVVVQQTGTDSASCGAPSAPCKTITQAIANAHPGDTVLVGQGTYHEQVVVPIPLKLVGVGATVDATGLSQGSGQTMNAAGVLVLSSASGSTIAGLRVTGAFGEGILVLSANNVTVTSNKVSGNDVGTPQNTTYLECQAQGQVPGDCGEGIHLMSASHSVVIANESTGNSGGILVTDEFGPATGNWIVANNVHDNLFDCGITLPSHSAVALDQNGVRQPALGGVYGNVIAFNRVVGNGVLGEGAGVLFAAAQPGSAAYNNVVIGNFIAGNNLAGVTMHAHAPNQDISGNRVTFNDIGTNNLGGDPDAGVTATTGVLVFSAVPSVTVNVTISHNHIHDNVNAIWTSPNVTVTG